MAKGILLGITGTVGLASPAITSSYYQTRELFWQKVKDDAIFEENNSESTDIEAIWGKLESKLSNFEFKDEDLKTIKTSSNSKQKGLKEWCFKSYKKTYWSLFQKENTNLLEDIKEACIWKIKDQLSDEKLIFETNSENNKEKFKNRIKSLKSHDDEKKGKLDSFLKKLKTEKETDDQWKKLESWCEKIYNTGYQGDKTNKWKLVNLYCKNN